MFLYINSPGGDVSATALFQSMVDPLIQWLLIVSENCQHEHRLLVWFIDQWYLFFGRNYKWQVRTAFVLSLCLKM
jgi:hypothetical protein